MTTVFIEPTGGIKIFRDHSQNEIIQAGEYHLKFTQTPRLTESGMKYGALFLTGISVSPHGFGIKSLEKDVIDFMEYPFLNNPKVNPTEFNANPRMAYRLKLDPTGALKDIEIDMDVFAPVFFQTCKELQK